MDYSFLNPPLLILAFFLGLIIILLGANFAIKSSIYYAHLFKTSKFFAGLILVSFATSAPELFISVESSIKNYNDVSIGNILGSNITNLCLVLGICGLFSRIKYNRKKLFFNSLLMLLGGVLIGIFLLIDNRLDRLEGVILIIIFILFTYISSKGERTSDVYCQVELKYNKRGKSTVKYTVIFILGILFLWLGSDIMILSVVKFSESIGIKDRIIAVTLVSFGTSMPELFTSLIAVLKKESGISLGNLIGSNIFNTYIIIGIASVLSPIFDIDTNVLNMDIPYMLFVYIILLVPLWFFRLYYIKKSQIFLYLIFYFLFLFLNFKLIDLHA